MIAFQNNWSCILFERVKNFIIVCNLFFVSKIKLVERDNDDLKLIKNVYKINQTEKRKNLLKICNYAPYMLG